MWVQAQGSGDEEKKQARRRKIWCLVVHSICRLPLHCEHITQKACSRNTQKDREKRPWALEQCMGDRRYLSVWLIPFSRFPVANVDSEEITPPTPQCVTWPLGGCSESQIPRSHTLWHGVTSKFTSREVTWHKWGVNQERKKETVEGIWETQSLYPKTHINFWEWIKTEETVRGDQVKCWAFL